MGSFIISVVFGIAVGIASGDASKGWLTLGWIWLVLALLGLVLSGFEDAGWRFAGFGLPLFVLMLANGISFGGALITLIVYELAVAFFTWLSRLEYP